MEDKGKDLEQKYLLALKQLEQERAINDRNLKEYKKDYERNLAEAQQKYSKACSEHDSRITELSKSHAQQCEELCREILKANLEADRLQSRLSVKEGTNVQRTAMPFEPERKKSNWNATLLLSILIVSSLSCSEAIYLCGLPLLMLS